MANIVKALGGGKGYTIVQMEDGSTQKVTGVRAVRNNNPGNIEYGAFAKSMGAVGSDGRFAVFPTRDHGLKAQENLLFNGKNYRNKSLTEAISTWAPPNENNTSSYQSRMLSVVGGQNKRMGDYSAQERAALMSAMHRIEGGGSGSARFSVASAKPVARYEGGRKVATRIDAGDFSTSSFQKALKAQQPSASTQIANVYDAYKSGRMSAQERAEFEHDVNSGKVMLPRGASLKTTDTSQFATAPIAPQGVLAAYANGAMNEQERAEFEADAKNGRIIVPSNFIENNRPSTLTEKAIGVGEAALATVTGMTTGAVGQAVGSIEGIGKSILNGTFGTQQGVNTTEETEMRRASDFSYVPKTKTGAEYAGAVGGAMQAMIPLTPMMGEFGAVAQSAKAARPMASNAMHAVGEVLPKPSQMLNAVKPAVVNTVNAVKSAPSKLAQAVGATKPAPAPVVGAGVDLGAMATSRETMNRVVAQEMPVPVELTKGQASRDFGQLRFEQEAAKSADLGKPIRDRMSQQRMAIQQSFDAWIDQTGAQTTDKRSTGTAVDKALRQKSIRDKNEIRVAYKNAEKAGEMETLVSTQKIVDVLNESVSAESTAPVLMAAKKELIRLGGAVEKDGVLVSIEQEPSNVLSNTGIDEHVISSANDALSRLKKNNPNFSDYGYLKNLDDNTTPNTFRAQGVIELAKKNGWEIVDGDTQGFSKFDESQYITLRKSLGADPNYPDYPPENATVKVRIANHENTTKSGRYDQPDINIAGNEYFVSELPSLLDEHFRSIYENEYGVPFKPASHPKTNANNVGVLSLKDMEQLRKFVNKTTGADSTNIKFAADIKGAIDASTEGHGGKLYKHARGLYSKYAGQYENRAVIADILENKRGSADRRVALEDVGDKILFGGSLDDMRFARRVLQTGGAEGRQAWKEIQGQALRYIKDEMTKSVATDENGVSVISASALDKAIRRFDSDGKLDYLFGKRGAEQLRSVNDLAKTLFTQPVGSVNHSNTASVLLAAMDMTISGSAGMPLPVTSGLKMLISHIKDKKLKARISDALGQGSKF